MKYPINGEGESNSCTVEAEDKLSLQDLSEQMEEIFNQTQGKATTYKLVTHDDLLFICEQRMIYDQGLEIVASILPGPFPAIQHETLKSWKLSWGQSYEIVLIICDKSVVDEHLYNHHNYRMKEYEFWVQYITYHSFLSFQ